MNPHVKEKFASYPDYVQPLMRQLRTLILDTANDLALGEVEESLKWGEPTYSVKTGSPIRMDWKEKSPDYYCLFFHCQTTLVATFRELYSDILVFEGNRAIVLAVSENLPVQAVRHCLQLAFQYKQIKHLPMLGV